MRLAPLSFRQTPRRIDRASGDVGGSLGFVKEVPAFRFLMITIVGLPSPDTIVEFRFLL